MRKFKLVVEKGLPIIINGGEGKGVAFDGIEGT
jgi:hypothetical protein